MVDIQATKMMCPKWGHCKAEKKCPIPTVTDLGDGVWVDTHLGDVLAEHTGPSKQLTKDFLEVVKGGKDVGTFRCIIVVGAPVVAKAVQKTLIELT